MRLDALIFDFDGTLAELNIDFAWLRQEVHGLARQLGFSDQWPGGYLLEEVEALAGELGADFAQNAMAFIQQAEMDAAARGRLFPFTRTLLAQAREQDYSLAVISRNCGPAIRKVFPEVDGGGLVFLPREAVVKPKPHPGHILDACLALETPPVSAAVVGDHPLDIAAALAAGCLAVGVASGRMSEDDLRAAGAALVLPDAADLLARLKYLA